MDIMQHKTVTLIDSSNVMRDVWCDLIRKPNNNYYVRHKKNRAGATIRDFRISKKLADKLSNMNIDDAYDKMYRHVMSKIETSTLDALWYLR